MSAKNVGSHWSRVLWKRKNVGVMQELTPLLSSFLKLTQVEGGTLSSSHELILCRSDCMVPVMAAVLPI